MRFGRPAQIFTAVSGALFLIAVFTHLGTKGGIPGVNDFTTNISNSLVRGSIKSIMIKSESMWAKTVRQRHEIRTQFGDMGFFPAVNRPTYFTTPYTVWDLIPASYNCPFEVERIGRMGDGGKWVCGMSRYERKQKPCILYSFGVQNETSFEREMLERTNCELWAYSTAVSGFDPAFQNEFGTRAHFIPAGIASSTDATKTPPYFTIQDLMDQNNHEYIDILKIDVEYAEFNALSSLNAYTQTTMTEFPIGQMLIELHIFQSQGITLPIFLDWWESMEYRGMRPAWTEPNLLAVSMKFEDGNPRLAEYTWLNVLDSKNKLFT